MTKMRSSTKLKLLCTGLLAVSVTVVVIAQSVVHSATLSWTASPTVGVSGYNVYRKTGTGNVSMIAGPVVSPYKDTAVTAGSTYVYTTRAVLSGVESVDSNAVTATIPSDPLPPPPPPGCITSVPGSFKNNAFAAQTGTFTVEFDAIPSAQTMDAVVGLSNGLATSYNSLGPIIRFVNSTIDARSGAAYGSVTPIPFTLGISYHFRLVVNRTAHTYNAFVKSGTNAETQLAVNFAFRIEQAAMTQVNNWSTTSEQGNVQVCNFVLTTTPPPPPPPPSLTIDCVKAKAAFTFTNMPSGSILVVTGTAAGIPKSCSIPLP